MTAIHRTSRFARRTQPGSFYGPVRPNPALDGNPDNSSTLRRNGV